MKIFLIIIGSLFLIGIVAGPSEKTTSIESEIAEPVKEKTPEELIRPALVSIDNFSTDTYKGTKEDMIYEISLFEEWSNLSNFDLPQSKELKKKLISLQKKEFPLLRKAFGEIMKDVLWEENIDVEVSGTTITLISGIYADNKAIKLSQEKLSEILGKFRYKRINYKWYKYDEDYSYYKINSKMDSEI